MGYYTDYTIDAKGFKNAEEAEFFQFILDKETAYRFERSSVGLSGDGHEIELTLSEAKFYEYKDVLIRVAKRFPHAIIDVYGEGEESGDIWKHRFRGGKDERIAAEMKFPEFTI